MSPNYNSNQSNTNFDPVVEELVGRYRRFNEHQQRLFQQSLLDSAHDVNGEPPSEAYTTWKSMADTLGPIEWAWRVWLAKGFLTIVAAESGMGKSALLLRIATCYLTGKEWPDGTQFSDTTGAVLWCEAEAAQALNLERAKEWGLPIEKIFTPLQNPLDDVSLEDPEHREAIQRMAMDPEVKLIIVDSLRGAHRGNEDASEIIDVVMWLAQLARDSGKPILLSHHLRKASLIDGPEVTLDRLRGSSAIVQPARLIWALDAPNPLTKEVKRLSLIKSNLGRFPEPIGVQINENGVHFGAAPERPKEATQQEKAMDLLLSMLEQEPQYADDVFAAMNAHGIAKRTLYDAKDALGVISIKEKTKNGRWKWSLPAKDANP